jgi:hypothetical protein
MKKNCHGMKQETWALDKVESVEKKIFLIFLSSL